MAIYSLTGYITETGELQLELPPDLPAGKVQVTLEIEPEPQKPLTGAEIVARLKARNDWWTDENITDGASYVEEIRRKEAERRNIKW